MPKAATAPGADYYKGAHRVVIGGVPCRLPLKIGKRGGERAAVRAKDWTPEPKPWNGIYGGCPLLTGSGTTAR